MGDIRNGTAYFQRGGEPMKAIVLSRDKVVKIRYNEDDKRNDLLDALMTVQGMEVIDRGYRG